MPHRWLLAVNCRTVETETEKISSFISNELKERWIWVEQREHLSIRSDCRRVVAESSIIREMANVVFLRCASVWEKITRLFVLIEQVPEMRFSNEFFFYSRSSSHSFWLLAFYKFMRNFNESFSWSHSDRFDQSNSEAANLNSKWIAFKLISVLLNIFERSPVKFDREKM